ncbi:MAG TPA: serine hydrolase domain-containing protein [Acidimicrobiales bacterium]|nr:serine hydrolase domain-containing protein [Acidimicrobiales bacterium]
MTEDERSRARAALAAMDAWPVGTAAGVVVRASGGTVDHGDIDRRFALASLTKVLTAVAVLVAVEEETVALDAPAGPPGATVRHLLAHASGLAPDEAVPLAPPGKRRIYSNAGFETLADAVAAAAAMPFDEYLRAAVLEPLHLTGTRLEGSPASGATGTVADLGRLLAELQAPTILAPATLAEATTTAFPGLDGVLPGFGRRSPNDWGLGVEVRGRKSPHWTAPGGSPRTYGHFGRAGGFVWVDPDAGVAAGCLTDRDFGTWATEAWPGFNQGVLDAFDVTPPAGR